MENRTFFQNCPRTKYIYIYRVPQCMSPRLNWDSPIPSPAGECAPYPLVGGEGGDPTTEEKALHSVCSVCPRIYKNQTPIFENRINLKCNWYPPLL